MLQWFYETIYGAVADFFTMMGNMGADIFDLDWISKRFTFVVTMTKPDSLPTNELQTLFF